MNVSHTLFVAAVAVAAIGCGSKSDSAPAPTLHVTGTVDPQARSLSGARAMAVSRDGRAVSAAIVGGAFSLDLHAGVYRVVIANKTRTGQLRVVGHVVSSTSRGRSSVIGVKDGGGSLSLGVLHQPGQKPSTSTTKTLSEKEKAGAEHEDAEHENEDDNDDKLCDDGDDVELEAEHAPGSAHEADEAEGPSAKPAKTCDVHDSDHDGKDD